MKSLKTSLLASSFIVAGSKYGHSAQITLGPSGDTVNNSFNLTDNSDPVIFLEESSISGSVFVGNNSVTNSGSLTSTSYQGIYFYIYGYDDAIVSKNTITNSGNINSTNDRGIHIYAGVVYGDVTVTDNSITNSGSISSYNDGMYLEARSTAYDGDDVYLTGNLMVNSGSIISSSEEGMDFDIVADDDARAVRNIITNSGLIDAGGEGIDFGVEGETVTLTGNRITNSGNIESGGEGISFYAYSTSFDAHVSGNIILNSKLIDAGLQGINFDIDADDNAHVSGNSIANSGTIEADYEGIRFNVYADDDKAHVSENSITNSGTIKADLEGIRFNVDADDDEAYISGNSIINSGTINSIQQSIVVDVYADGDLSFVSNFISNSGTIDSLDKGIEITIDTDYADVFFSDNTIINSGSINADDEGILIEVAPDFDSVEDLNFSTNHIINSGQIKSIKDEGMQIDIDAKYNLVFSSNTIANYGTIDAEDQGIELELSADGYLDMVSNSIINSGTILSGDEGIQIYLTSDDDVLFSQNYISNSGSILSEETGISIRGYSFNDEVVLSQNEISNSGRIQTTGSDAHGIELHTSTYAGLDLIDDNVLSNTGSIQTYGANSVGISLSGEFVEDNSIYNSGKLISAYGDAVEIDASLSADGNSLALAAPAFIGGYLNMDDFEFVNLTSGPSHSNFWTFNNASGSDFDPTGPLPWFRDGTNGDAVQTFATFDPSGVAARTHALGDASGMASDFVQKGLDGLDSSKAQYRVWIAGGLNRQAFAGNGETTLDQDVVTSGTAIGFASKVSETLKFALMVGGAKSEAKVDSRFSASHENSSEGIIGGAFLRHSAGALNLDLGLNGGWSENKTRRFVNDNLADNGFAPLGTEEGGHATLGNSWNDGEYQSWWVGPEFAAAFKIDLSKETSLTPSLRVRYAMEHGDAYTETSDTDRVAYDDVNSLAEVGAYDASLFEGDFGLTFSQIYGLGRASLTGGYIVRHANGSNSIDVSMLGEELAVPVDVSQFNAPYIGAGLMLGVAGQVMLNVDGRAVFADGEVGTGVRASINGSF